MLLVFADDWGRHPSSCQHLVRQLLPRHRVVWVNTIGTRAPAFNLATLQRGWGKLQEWTSRQPACIREENPQVVSPRMWPWCRNKFDRWLNKTLLVRGLEPLLRTAGEPVHAITTIPIVADLIGALKVDRWLYYCVDDFSTWPGLDQRSLGRLDAELLRKCDDVIAVSDNLVQHAARHGRDAGLLSHGVDLDFWQNPTISQLTNRLAGLVRPLYVLWGVVDRRLDAGWIRQLASSLERGTILLAGPLQNPDPELLQTPRVVHLPPLAFEHLPELGSAADVLIMPYADLPVTRAMQPLKLKEYLATGKPVVVSNLPAVQSWDDCLDVAHSADEFVDLVKARQIEGVPADQRTARQRLQQESWRAKADQFERWVLGSNTKQPASTDLRSLQRRQPVSVGST
jgi:glycosyltransferase involved in cell wall biosynthesis